MRGFIRVPPAAAQPPEHRLHVTIRFELVHRRDLGEDRGQRFGQEPQFPRASRAAGSSRVSLSSRPARRAFRAPYPGPVFWATRDEVCVSRTFRTPPEPFRDALDVSCPRHGNLGTRHYGQCVRSCQCQKAPKLRPKSASKGIHRLVFGQPAFLVRIKGRLSRGRASRIGFAPYPSTALGPSPARSFSSSAAGRKVATQARIVQRWRQ